MVAAFKKCYVLFWKCLILRRKNWLLSLVEIMCPILVTLAAFSLNYIGTKYEGASGGDNNPFSEGAFNIGVPKNIFQLNNATVRLKYLAYNPVNEFTNTIMRNVKNSGFLPTIEFLEHLKNEMELNEWLKSKSLLDRHNESIGVTFSYISKITNEFKYIIRSNSKSMLTDKTQDCQLSPFNIYQKQSSFLKLQIVLESELLKSTGFDFHNRHIIFGELPKKKPLYAVAGYIFYIFIMIAYVFLVISVTREVLQEKSTGIKELMKIHGISNWMIWTHWLIYFLIAQIPVTICMTLLLSVFEPIVLQVNVFVIWLLLFLCTLNCIFIFFSLSCFFNKPIRGTSICVIGWFVLNTSTLLFIEKPGDFELYLQIFMCLIPLHNLSWAVFSIHSFKTNNVEWTLDHLFTKGFTGSQISVGLSIVIFFFEAMFWALLFILLDAAKPGPYGIAQPFAFVCRCCKRLCSRKDSTQYNAEEYKANLPLRFELPPQGAKVGIHIRGLRKEYGWLQKVVAVERVDLDIYEGEIMALLGHNGAGKTTTMSMITGMFSPTQGEILVDGKDINSELSHFRQNLGLCTQHNMYFPKLTVIENLLFFGMLKGMSYTEAKEYGTETLQLLNMIGKKDSNVSKLSGGMQRRLCLGISLVGKPKVLILDEPTSGLDPENRRQIWNIILKMRGSRTVLITTHFMEEADVLGDRIAIMDRGQIVCCGTTMFLKKIYGTGYTLHILKEVNTQTDDIYTEIKRHIPKFQMKIISKTQVDFVIKEDLVKQFPALFEMLEKQQKSLGITSISVTCTTLEDVFLRVAEKSAEGDFVEGEDELERLQSIKSRLSTIGREKVTGLQLFFQTLEALFWKRFIFFYRNYLSFSLTLLCSIALVFLMVWLSIFEKKEVSLQNPLKIGLNIYPGSINLLKHDEINSKIAKVAATLFENQGSSIILVPRDTNMSKFAIGLEKKSIGTYTNKTLTALEFVNETFLILYQPLCYIHSPTIVANLGSNILLQDYTNNTGSITVKNHPYVLPQDEKCGETNFYRAVTPFYWLFLMSCALIISVMNFIPFLNEERSSGFKHQQTIAGVSPLIYWICNFIFDFCFSLLINIIFIVIIFFFGADILSESSQLLRMIIQVLIFYSISGLFFVYVFTFLVNDSVVCSGLFLMYNLIFTLFPSFVIYLDIIENYPLFLALIILLSFNPNFAATISMAHIANAAVDDYLCRVCGKADCVIDTELLKGMPTNKNRAGISIYILFLALSWILYAIIIIIIESETVRKILLAVQYKVEKSSRYSTFEDDVRREAEEVAESKKLGETNNPLRVEGLVKKYVCGPKAVNQVTFLVSGGECFGLLGVNGAGKTTTFKILTGDTLPKSGDAFVTKYSVIRNKRKYLSCIGYCPQFDALLNILTGEEILKVIAKIRGIPREDINEEVKFLLSMLGITEHAKKRSVTYSGGTKRKLSTAIAFIGNPEVVFLDEPTTGVDPVSRRLLWGVVQARQWAGQAVILTSHSMEECEALCSRLTIMRAGQMQCIGTLEYLKKKYGKGYTVLIKLINSNDEELERLKTEFLQVFPESLIKDEHASLIHYQILDPLIPLAKIFTKMLKLKIDFEIFEDFTVSNTTLEQLFLTFARKEENVIRRRSRFSWQ